MAGRTLTIDILTREAQSVAAQKRLQKELQTTSKDIDKASKSSLSLGSALGGLAVGAGLMKLSKDSQDLGRQQTATNAIFGASAEQINAFGEGAAEALGMSNAEALTAANTFGDMFTRLQIGQADAAGMSTQMVQLATDFAALKGADPSAVIEGMSSAFRGEYDALQRYIPSITDAAIKQAAMAETGKTNEKSLTEQEKALAVYQLMLDSAGVSQGAFAEMADTAAGKTQIAAAKAKDASAEFGQNLAPAVALAAQGIGFLSDQAQSLPPVLQTAALAGAGLAVVGPRIVSAWDGVAGSLGNVKTALGSTVTEVGYLRSAGLGLVAAAVGYNVTYKALESLTDTSVSVDALADAVNYLGASGSGLEDVFSAVEGNSAADAADQFKLAAEGITGAVDKISAHAEQVPGAVAALFGQDYDTEMEKLAKAKEAVAAYDKEFAAAARRDPVATAAAVKVFTDALLAQGLTIDEINQLLPEYGAAIGSVAAKEKSAAAATDEHTKAIEEQNAAAAEQYDAATAAADADEAVNQAVIGVADAHRGVTDALADEADAQRGVTDAVAAVADARRSVGDALDAEADARRSVGDAMRSEEEAARGVADAQAEVVDATEELAQAQREAAGDSDAMRDALDGVSDAQDALTEAQENTTDAQRALDQATADYSDTLAQLQQDAAGAADDVLSAEIRLRKAQAELANLGSDGKPVTSDDRLAAEIAVREAQRRLEDARRAAAEAAQNVDANDDGAAASEAVVSASEDVEQAKRDEAAAQEALGDAVQTVADTQVSANAAVQTAEENLQTAIEGVSEAQRKRVEAHQGVLDAQAAVAKAAQGVRDAEAEVAARIADVGKAQQAVTDAKDATVAARGEVEAAERKVWRVLKDQADAHFAATGNARDYQIALGNLLKVMDPNDPYYQATMAYYNAVAVARGGGAQQNVPPTRDPDAGPRSGTKGGGIFTGKKDEYNAHGPAGKGDQSAAQQMLMRQVVEYIAAADGPDGQAKRAAAVAALFGMGQGAKADVVQLTASTVNVGGMGATTKGGGIFDGVKGEVGRDPWPTLLADTSAMKAALRDIVRNTSKGASVQVVGGDPLTGLAGAVAAKGRR